MGICNGVDLTIFRGQALKLWLQSSGNETGGFCISRRYPSFNHTVAHDRLCNCPKDDYGGLSEEAPRAQHHHSVTLKPVRVSGRIETCIPVTSADQVGECLSGLAKPPGGGLSLPFGQRARAPEGPSKRRPVLHAGAMHTRTCAV